jgi:hypothetical protein
VEEEDEEIPADVDAVTRSKAKEGLITTPNLKEDPSLPHLIEAPLKPPDTVTKKPPAFSYDQKQPHLMQPSVSTRRC